MKKKKNSASQKQAKAWTIVAFRDCSHNEEVGDHILEGRTVTIHVVTHLVTAVCRKLLTAKCTCCFVVAHIYPPVNGMRQTRAFG